MIDGCFLETRTSVRGQILARIEFLATRTAQGPAYRNRWKRKAGTSPGEQYFTGAFTVATLCASNGLPVPDLPLFPSGQDLKKEPARDPFPPPSGNVRDDTGGDQNPAAAMLEVTLSKKKQRIRGKVLLRLSFTVTRGSKGPKVYMRRKMDPGTSPLERVNLWQYENAIIRAARISAKAHGVGLYRVDETNPARR